MVCGVLSRHRNSEARLAAPCMVGPGCDEARPRGWWRLVVPWSLLAAGESAAPFFSGPKARPFAYAPVPVAFEPPPRARHVRFT